MNVHVSDPTGKPIGEPIEPTDKPTTFEQGTAGGAAHFLPFGEDFGGEEGKFELALDDDEIAAMYVNDIINRRIVVGLSTANPSPNQPANPPSPNNPRPCSHPLPKSNTNC